MIPNTRNLVLCVPEKDGKVGWGWTSAPGMKWIRYSLHNEYEIVGWLPIEGSKKYEPVIASGRSIEAVGFREFLALYPEYDPTTMRIERPMEYR